MANAKSIPIAEAIQREFDDLDYVYDLGELDLNISGCMNACGHHHIGHIGILGWIKRRRILPNSIGWQFKNQAALGEVLGPSFGAAEVPTIIRKILEVYLAARSAEESFLDTYHRIGLSPFKEKVYAKTH